MVFSRSPLCPGGGSLFRSLLVVISCFTLPCRPAAALDMYFGWDTGYLAFPDQDPTFDLNPATSIIDFNVTVGGYNLVGTVDYGSGPTFTALLGPNIALRLTNFTATATAGGLNQVRVSFKDTLSGTFSSVFGGDMIDPFASNSTNTAIPAGTDQLDIWQGYLDVNVFPPAFGGLAPQAGPAWLPSSPPSPYVLYGHGPNPLPGPYVNPILGADLYFTLGQAGDQFILLSSANVGISVPEPGSITLLGVGLVAVSAFRVRKRMANCRP